MLVYFACYFLSTLARTMAWTDPDRQNKSNYKIFGVREWEINVQTEIEVCFFSIRSLKFETYRCLDMMASVSDKRVGQKGAGGNHDSRQWREASSVIIHPRDFTPWTCSFLHMRDVALGILEILSWLVAYRDAFCKLFYQVIYSKSHLKHSLYHRCG
jgi:hypothetical protein